MGVSIPNLAPFPVQPELTAIAIAYSNPAYSLIADKVMPRVGPPLGVKAFRWWEYDLADGFTVPDTLVGRKGRPNEVDWSAAERDGSTRDHGLDEPVPNDDITQAQASGGAFNPLGAAVERVTNLVNLGREQRVASIAFNASNYAASNVLTLSGTDKFSDDGTDPIKVLLEMLDTPILRPNSLTMGQAVWTRLMIHPKVQLAFYPNGQGAGSITRQMLVDKLEIAELNIGTSRVNLTRKGQAPSLARTWGPHIAAHFKDPTATNGGGVTWGFTMQYGAKIAGAVPDPDIGLRGGQRVRVGESVAEVVAAKDAGFLIENAV